MTVKEYIERSSVSQITFIKARARKDAYSPFYHAEYQTTPLFARNDVIKHEVCFDYIVLNDRQEAITWLSGADWNVHIRKGFARCLLVISHEDFEMLYPSEDQREHMAAYIDKKLDPERE